MSPPTDRLPGTTFSVVVPTYNRPNALGHCLSALAAQDYPSDHYEVIVVDDGSTGKAVAPVVAQFGGRCPIRLVRQSQAGPSSARNCGATLARFEYLAFTDDDCAPAPTWLACLAGAAVAHPACGIGGHTVNQLTRNIYSAASQDLIQYLYAYYNPPNATARFFASNNLAFPTDGFLALGGFDTTYTGAASEDRELCSRWLQSGRRLVYARDACVAHAHALSMRTFWRQHFTYGRGARRYHRARSARGLRRPPMEPAGFYAKLVAWPLREGLTRDSAMRSALLGLSQVAHTAGFLCELAMNQPTLASDRVQE